MEKRRKLTESERTKRDYEVSYKGGSNGPFDEILKSANEGDGAGIKSKSMKHKGANNFATSTGRHALKTRDWAHDYEVSYSRTGSLLESDKYMFKRIIEMSEMDLDDLRHGRDDFDFDDEAEFNEMMHGSANPWKEDESEFIDDPEDKDISEMEEFF